MSNIENMSVPAGVEAGRILWGNLLARYANKRRQELGLTIAQAAELSGIEISQWSAMEAGCWAPEELNTVQSVAATLHVRWTDLDFLALFAAHTPGRVGRC